MNLIQVHSTHPKGITLYYKHVESGKEYGLLINYESLKGTNLESLCSWIDKAKKSIASHVYRVHDVIIENYVPSDFEKSKLSPEDYIKKCEQDAKEHYEKQNKRRKFLNESDSILSDILMGIRST